MVSTITFKVRRCTDCDHKAVALGGVGADCAECNDGVYRDWVGSQTSEMSGQAFDELKDHAEVIEYSED